MRKRIHMYSESDVIRCDLDHDLADGRPIVWIRSENAAVSLTFDKSDRAKLRAALDAADASPTRPNQLRREARDEI